MEIDNRLLDSIRTMGNAFSANEALGHLTCQEFDTVLQVFILAGLTTQAKDAVVAHGWGDKEEEDEHHDMYVSESEDDRKAMAHVRAAATALGVQL